MADGRKEGRAAAWWRGATVGQRLRVALVPVVLSFVCVGTAHTLGARARWESLVPVALGLAAAGAAFVTSLWS